VSQNSRNVLRSVYVRLSLPAPSTEGPAAGAKEAAARENVLATLGNIGR
jgi:hypothetical protein